MKYEKVALTFEEQATQLIDRGLIADHGQLMDRLQATNYYRFTSYLYTFRDQADRYLEGTTLETVWNLYRFDHGLRMLMLDAIETIEVQVRTQLAYHFAHAHGPFAYLESCGLPNLDPKWNDFGNWEQKLRLQVRRSRTSKGREDFIIHFYRKYGDSHDMPPIWMMVELMDFGSTLTFFRGVSVDLRREVAKVVGQPEEVVLSWLLALNSVRNRCAHHARLWNWRMGNPVKIPNSRKFPDWHAPALPNDKPGIMLLIIRHWLERVNSSHSWHTRVENLFDAFPEIDLVALGLDLAWREHPVWSPPP
jgi:abortive infection bacteriophage resistance protein